MMPSSVLLWVRAFIRVREGIMEVVNRESPSVLISKIQSADLAYDVGSCGS